MSIPYEKPYDLPRQDHDTYRDQEEKEYEEARRKGNVLNLVEKDAQKDAQKAMNDLFAEPVAEEKPAPVKKATPAKKTTAKKVAKKSAKSKR